MKNTPLFASLLAMGVFFISSVVYAETIIYQQPISTTELSTNASASWGVNVSLDADILSSITLTIGSGTTNASSSLEIFCYTDGSFVSHCDGHSGRDAYVSGVQLPLAGQNIATFNFASQGFSLDPTKRYLFGVLFSNFGGSSGRVYGTSSPAQCTAGMGCNVNSGAPYMYIRASDGEEEEDFTTSYISQINSPIQSEVTETTAVTFDFDYWNTGFEGFDKSGVALSNLTVGQNVVVTEQDILITGAGDYENLVSLTEGSAYMYRPYLRNSTTHQRVYGETIIFHVVENQGGQSVIPDLNEDNATSTFETSFGSFMRAIDLLETKFPFNWFTETILIFSDLDDSSGEAAELTLDFSNVSSTTDGFFGGEPITLFSSTTVTHFMPAGFLTTIRLFISGTLYFGLAANIFFTVRRRFS